jgi:hypothetical protein
MGLGFRKRLRLGPLALNIGRRGLSSVSLRVGPFTWSPIHRRVTTNLPGGLYHTQEYGGRKRRPSSR